MQKMGVLDRIIEKLPEIHIPRYNYCGINTNLEERLSRNEPGINKLDYACKDHDIAYNLSNDLNSRYKADKVFISKVKKRIFEKDSLLDEHLAATIVSMLMIAKMTFAKIELCFRNVCLCCREKECENL